MLLAFFRFYSCCKTYFFKTLILALIKSWFKAFLMLSNWRFLFLRLMISLSKSLKMLAIAICSFRGVGGFQNLLKLPLRYKGYYLHFYLFEYEIAKTLLKNILQI